MASQKKAAEMRLALVDSSVPIEHRKRMMLHLCMDDGDDSTKIVREVLDAAGAASADALHDKRAKEMAELIGRMQEGPLRAATFLGMLDPRRDPKAAVARAHVVLDDGSSVFTTVPDAGLAASLRAGDPVLLEAQGRALLERGLSLPAAGEEARLERDFADGRVEVSLRDGDRHVFWASAVLADALRGGRAAPGAALLVCARRRIAFDALPDAVGPSRYRYLAKESVPDVLVARDIGSPPRYIDDVVEHVRTEMRDPRLHRRYKQRACITKLLAGVSGSGKTLSIHALWRRLYDVMAEETGVAIEDLPPRVMRLRPSGVLSEWLGRTDKNLDQFFDEAEALADETFVGRDGRAHRLPVLAILEEIDALGQARGNDTVYDRILATALDRLDAGRASLKGRLVIFLATTNVPHQVDPALLRRIGGTVERFGRLTRRGFAAVLAKHVDGLPFTTADASGEAEARRRAASDVIGWLFSPNGADKGQAEVHFVGSPTPTIKKRRDFLTGALVDRAVQEAARAACRAERDGAERPGLDRALLMDAFDRQIRAVVDQLDPANAHNFLDLPDGVRVASIRRIARPAVLPFELERVS